MARARATGIFRVVRDQTLRAERDLELATGETEGPREFPSQRGVHEDMAALPHRLETCKTVSKEDRRTRSTGLGGSQADLESFLVGEAALDIAVYLELLLPTQAR